MKRLIRLAAFCMAACLSAAGSAEPQFTHASWTSANGVPGMISALAQTPDGYLWLATYEGLYRFDGVSFEHVPPAAGHPDGAIPATSVYVSSRGELWVGYAGRGGVEVYRGGRSVRVPMPHPPGEVTAFQEDSLGAMWAIGGRQPNSFFRYAKGAWQSVGAAEGLPPEFVTSMLAARNGIFWVTTRQHLLFLRPGARRFEDTGEQVQDGSALAESPSGDIWISGPPGTRMIPDYPRGKRLSRSAAIYPARSPVRRVSAIFDHEGALWGTTYVGGAYRINAPGRDPARESSVVHFGTTNGLTSNQAVAILEDREHNVWIATEIGLDQFRRADVEEARLPPRTTPRGFRMAADREGAIFVANGNALFKAAPGGDLQLYVSGIDATALCPDRVSGIWAAVEGRMELLRGGRRARSIPLPGAAPVTGCSVDAQGRLWVARPENGVLALEGSAWRHLPLPPKLGRPRDVVVDTEGFPLILLGNRVVVQVRPEGSAVLDNERLGVAGLTGMFSTDGGVLIAGGTGLVRWNGRDLSRISIKDQPWLRGVRGLVETKLGQTWLLSNKGIHRIATATLRNAFTDPRRALLRMFFGEQDGLSSHTNGEDGPQALEGGDGRIWFLTRQGPVWIDPDKLSNNPVVPTVIIRGLTAEGQHFQDPSGMELQPGTRNVSIDYTALSLSVPNRVSFKYKLEGVDRGWVDPGTRRQAFYTNLGPGTHHFRVIAANDKGLWNERGAALEFRIAPRFTQTWLFYLLCLVIGLGLLWLAYAARVRSISHRLRIRNAERMSERERIARELHDTLLQTIQALMLRFQVAAESVEGADARRKLDIALDRAEEALIEGRDRVSDLRQERHSDELEAAILGTIGRQELPSDLKIGVTVHGVARRIDRTLLKEVNAVVGEALFNVCRHAQAKKADVTVVFEPDQVSISVSDDGIGIDECVLVAGQRAGHFGLPGMRERARQAGGTLTIRSMPGQGTLVRLILPTDGSTRRSLPRLLGSLLRQRKLADVE